MAVALLVHLCYDYYVVYGVLCSIPDTKSWRTQCEKSGKNSIKCSPNCFVFVVIDYSKCFKGD